MLVILHSACRFATGHEDCFSFSIFLFLALWRLGCVPESNEEHGTLWKVWKIKTFRMEKLRESVTSGKVQHCIWSHRTLFIVPVAGGMLTVWTAARMENPIHLTWGQKKLYYTHLKMKKHSYLLVECLSFYSLFLNCTWLKCRPKLTPAWHIDGVHSTFYSGIF